MCCDPIRFYPIDRAVEGVLNDKLMSKAPKIDALRSDRLMPLFQPWPPPPAITEAGLVFGTEVSVVVTRWLELADASFVQSEIPKPPPRRLHRHTRRHTRRERAVFRKRRRSA
jgi:hypothetical protein